MEVGLTCTTSLDVSHSSGPTPSFVWGLSLDARIYSLYCFELQHWRCIMHADRMNKVGLLYGTHPRVRQPDVCRIRHRPGVKTARIECNCRASALRWWLSEWPLSRLRYLKAGTSHRRMNARQTEEGEPLEAVGLGEFHFFLHLHSISSQGKDQPPH